MTPLPMAMLKLHRGSSRLQLHAGHLNLGVLLVDASAADVRTQIHKAESSKDVGVARRLATSGSSASVTST